MATVDDFGGPGQNLSAPALGGPTGWAKAVRDALTALAYPAANPQSGTSYTLVLSDSGKLVELGNASAITLTVPTNASVPFPVGTRIELLQTDAGQVTVGGAVGVTVDAKTELKLSGQWAGATLIKRATDTWVLIGAGSETVAPGGGTATGGTITEASGYRTHTFTASGTFEVSGGDLASLDVLVVGGGGGGGASGGGGGGAGGVISTNVATLAAGAYTVTRGAGGAGGIYGGAGPTSGGNSVFDSYTAVGGGGGAGNGYPSQAGGSGGGGGRSSTGAAAGTTDQGYAGGTGASASGGGGGGASAAGAAAGANPGSGGAGITWYDGVMVGGGGGGGADTGGGSTPGSASHGGGAGAAVGGSNGTAGTANTGGGGGGGGELSPYRGGDGGSGVVIIRYPI